MLQRSPSNRFSSSRTPTFRSHVRAHEAVVNNESLYGDAPPILGNAFTTKKTAKRHNETLLILLRAAKRAAKAGDKVLAEKFYSLHDKLAS